MLKTLHDELDRAVLGAYGWGDLRELMEVVNGSAASQPREEAKRALDEALLERLVALNAERAAEEKRGLIRWLRPEFQNPAGRAAPTQVEMETEEETAAPARPAQRRPWPATLPEQVKAVAELLAASRAPLDEDAIAACFTGRGPWKKRLPQIIDTLVAVGRVRRDEGLLAISPSA